MEVEGGLHRENLRHGEPFRLGDPGPVHIPGGGEGVPLRVHQLMGQQNAHDGGHNVAHDDSAEDTGGGCNTFCKVLQHHDNRQHQQTQQEVWQGAEVLGPAASGEGVHAHADEAQADGQHHAAGDHRREELPQGLNEKAQGRLADAAHHGRADDGAVGQDAAAHGGVGGHALHDPQKAGAGAHDDRHLPAHGADGPELNQGDEARRQHGVLEQGDVQRGLLAGNAADAADDHQRRQVAHEHGQYVLHPQGDGLAQGNAPVEIVGAGVLCGLLLHFVFVHLSFLLIFCAPWAGAGRGTAGRPAARPRLFLPQHSGSIGRAHPLKAQKRRLQNPLFINQGQQTM